MGDPGSDPGSDGGDIIPSTWGSGDGRLVGLLKLERPQAKIIAFDYSPVMLKALRRNFAGFPHA